MTDLAGYIIIINNNINFTAITLLPNIMDWPITVCGNIEEIHHNYYSQSSSGVVQILVLHTHNVI